MIRASIKYHMEDQDRFSNRPIEVENDIDAIMDIFGGANDAID